MSLKQSRGRNASGKFENNQTKSKRGGARIGAGRKKGSATKKTRAIADRAAGEGLTPLEVVLKTMRALVEASDKLEKKPKAPGEKQTTSPLDLMVEASSVAKDAAPYIHPRLSAVEHSGKVGMFDTKSDEELADEIRSLNEKLGYTE